VMWDRALEILNSKISLSLNNNNNKQSQKKKESEQSSSHLRWGESNGFRVFALVLKDHINVWFTSAVTTAGAWTMRLGVNIGAVMHHCTWWNLDSYFFSKMKKERKQC